MSLTGGPHFWMLRAKVADRHPQIEALQGIVSTMLTAPIPFVVVIDFFLVLSTLVNPRFLLELQSRTIVIKKLYTRD
jgi:hypothetical protein